MQYFPLESVTQAVQAFHDVHSTALVEIDEDVSRSPEDADYPVWEYVFSRDGISLTWSIDVQASRAEGAACEASVHVHVGAVDPLDTDDLYFIECSFVPARGWELHQGRQEIFRQRNWRLESDFEGPTSLEWVLKIIQAVIRIMKQRRVA